MEKNRCHIDEYYLRHLFILFTAILSQMKIRDGDDQFKRLFFSLEESGPALRFLDGVPGASSWGASVR